MALPPTLFSRSGKRKLASLLLIALPAMAQQYSSNDLTPLTATAAKLNGASGGKQVGGGSNGHALLESGDARNSIDLHPAGYSSSMATSTDDAEQCGYAYSNLGGQHAVKWSGSAASMVDLHNSTGYTWSYCLGTHGGQQVGYGERPVYFTTYQHAFVWSGGVATDLHPILGTYGYTKALGVHNGQQVGYGAGLTYPYGDTIAYQEGHALLWTGTQDSVVDLHPAAYKSSQAWATNGVQQGGWATDVLTSYRHAMLWSGTAASAVDLHSSTYTDTRVTAMTDTQQVGDGWVGVPGAVGSVRHALVWSGTAASVVDLNQYLPGGYTHAVATGVDGNGNVVGYAYNTAAYGLVMPPDAIAVVFAPGQPPAGSLSTITMTPANPAPGSTVQLTLTLGGPAPAGGTTVTFVSSNAAILPAPAPVVITEGQGSATVSITVAGSTLQVPTYARLLASAGTTTRSVNTIITPVVNVTGVTVNPVEGGFGTNGSVTLSIPAQAGGATVSLTSGNPALVTLPASVNVPQGVSTVAFAATTASVTAATSVPVTASYNGVSVSTTATLSPAPVVAVSSVSIPLTVGGQSTTGTVTVTNYPRNASGVDITITSGDTKTLQIPVAVVNIPQYATSATFAVTTAVVTGSKGVSVKAVYGASNATTTVTVIPIPTITIVQADYLTDLQMFKVAATTIATGAVLTYGTDPLSAPIGTMQFELGQWKGATTMLTTAPAYATVWSSDGGQATMAVTQKLSTAGGGGGNGGGGGGGTSTTYKLTATKNGKGTVTASPAAASYAAGTVVTLTATPDPGSPWLGWTGACSGTATTCKVTMNSNLSVTANFK